MANYSTWFPVWRDSDCSGRAAGTRLPELTAGDYTAQLASGCATPAVIGYEQTGAGVLVDEIQVTPGHWRILQSTMSALYWIAEGVVGNEAGFRWGDGTGANVCQTWTWTIVGAGEDGDYYYVECSGAIAQNPRDLQANGQFNEDLEPTPPYQVTEQVSVGAGWEMAFTGPCEKTKGWVHHVEHTAGADTFRVYTLQNCIAAASTPEGETATLKLTTYAPAFLEPWTEPKDMRLLHCEACAAAYSLVTLDEAIDEQGRLELLNSDGDSARIAYPGTYDTIYCYVWGGTLAGDRSADIIDRIGIEQDPVAGTWKTYLYFGALLPDGTSGTDWTASGLEHILLVYFPAVGSAYSGRQISVPGRCAHCRRDYSGSWPEPTTGAVGTADDDSVWFCDARDADITPTEIDTFLARDCYQPNCSSFELSENHFSGQDAEDLISKLRTDVALSEKQTYAGSPTFYLERLGTPSIHLLTADSAIYTNEPASVRSVTDFIGRGQYGRFAETATDGNGNESKTFYTGGIYKEDTGDDFAEGFLAEDDDDWGETYSSAQRVAFDDTSDPVGLNGRGGRRAWPNRLWPKIGFEAGDSAPSGRGEGGIQRFGDDEGRSHQVVIPDAFGGLTNGVKTGPGEYTLGTDIQYLVELYSASGNSRTRGGSVMGARIVVQGPDNGALASRLITSGTVAKVTAGTGYVDIECDNKTNEGQYTYYAEGYGSSLGTLTWKQGGGVVAPPDDKRLNNAGCLLPFAWWGSPEHLASPGHVARFASIAVDDVDLAGWYILRANAFAGTAEGWNGSVERVMRQTLDGFIDFSTDNVQGNPDKHSYASADVSMRDHLGVTVTRDTSVERPELASLWPAKRFWWDEEKAHIYYVGIYGEQVTVRFEETGGGHTDVVCNLTVPSGFPYARVNIDPDDRPVGGVVSVYSEIDDRQFTVLASDPTDRELARDECVYVEIAPAGTVTDAWVQFSFDNAAEPVRVEYDVAAADSGAPGIAGKPTGWDTFANKRDVLRLADPDGTLAANASYLIGIGFTVTMTGRIGPYSDIAVYIGPNDVDVRDAAYLLDPANYAVDRADGTIWLKKIYTDTLDPEASYCVVVEADLGERRGDFAARNMNNLVAQIGKLDTVELSGGMSVASAMWASIAQLGGPRTFACSEDAGGNPQGWTHGGTGPSSFDYYWGLKWGDYEASGSGCWNSICPNWSRFLPGAWPITQAERTLYAKSNYADHPYYNGVGTPTNALGFVTVADLPKCYNTSEAAWQTYPHRAPIRAGEAYQRNVNDGVTSTAGIGWPDWWGSPSGPGGPYALGGTGGPTGAGVSNTLPPNWLEGNDMRGAGFYCPVATMSFDERIMRLPHDASITAFYYRAGASAGVWNKTWTWTRGAPEYDGNGYFTTDYILNGYAESYAETAVTKLTVDILYEDQYGMLHAGGFGSVEFDLDGKIHVVDDPGLLQSLLAVKGGIATGGGIVAAKAIYAVPAIDTHGMGPGEDAEPGSMLEYLHKYTQADLQTIGPNRKPYRPTGVMGSFWKTQLAFPTGFAFSIEFLGCQFQLPNSFANQTITYGHIPAMI